MTTTNPFEARRAEQAADQDRINEVYAVHGYGAARTLALTLAEIEHAEYPQYEGHWDGWTLGIATLDCKSKGGDQALRGDIVLVKIDRPMLCCTPSHTFYSVRLGWDCGFSYGVEPVNGWANYYAEHPAA